MLDPASTIRVGTLNLRNTADRWSERAGLLIEQLSELEPDVIGLQEIRWPSCQAHRIRSGISYAGRQHNSRLQLVRAQKTGLRHFWEGLGILTDLPVLESEHRSLRSGNRVAQRALVRLPSGHVLDFYNTHLDHAAGNDAVRTEQLQRILAWMAERRTLPQILVGDFNSEPDDPAILLATQTLRSAYRDVHGREPDRTVPAPLSRTYGGDGSVIDYIFVNDRIAVHDAWITFERTASDDDRLTASDHFGLAATISIRT